jgi:hypothetical protein
MIRFLFAISFSSVAVFSSFAQNYGTSNPIPPQGSTPVLQTNNLQQNPQAQVPVPAPPAVPAVPQVSAPDKPAVVITAQGTVLNDEQKRLVSQKLQEIPGVVVITNRIHVVGQINEAAGATTTNRGRMQRSRDYRTPR